ncbi:hypothetical protein [Leifsonia soli]|uniref:Uncharacterized protein n=1 Tax=Leifsonia soli TaxID=582665 RepID=A0A852T2E2_9MICO|nr:hypothetical protein [Leifsonia soli]NYD75045.1 hypothetical protein [Leifsonia soli]
MTIDESAPTLRHPGFDASSAARWHRALPDHLAVLLRNAHADEQEALGPHLRAAYLLTRQVISALLRAGYPARLLAAELAVRSETIRTRAQAGWMLLGDIAALAGIDEDELARRCVADGAVVEDGRLHSDDLARILSAPATTRDGR